MCLNKCTCAISKCTDSDSQSQGELADDVTGGKLRGWPVEERKEKKKEVDRQKENKIERDGKLNCSF